MTKIKKAFGFTLAEVLITLAVIGVVAAMTIPTMVANYQKTQYVTQLKKSYTVIQQALKQIMASEGVTQFDQTGLFDGTDYQNAARNDKIDEIIRTNFKVVKSCKNGDDSCQVAYKFINQGSGGNDFGSNYYKFYTTDGTLFGLNLGTSCPPNLLKTTKIKAVCGYVKVDINGVKNPNTMGRDFFEFLIGHDGTLYGTASHEDADYNNNQQMYWGTGFFPCSNDTNTSFGYGCAGRIIEEGWQMNY